MSGYGHTMVVVRCCCRRWRLRAGHILLLRAAIQLEAQQRPPLAAAGLHLLLLLRARHADGLVLLLRAAAPGWQLRGRGLPLLGAVNRAHAATPIPAAARHMLWVVRPAFLQNTPLKANNGTSDQRSASLHILP